MKNAAETSKINGPNIIIIYNLYIMKNNCFAVPLGF